MIENWDKMTREDKMHVLIREMADNYYRLREIDNIPEAIKIMELNPDNVSHQDFFRIALHSSIPYEYLESDIPIIGMERNGTSIAFGENKALVDRVSSKVSAIKLDKLDFKNLIEDAYNRINNSIAAIFIPIDFFTQINKELNLEFMNGDMFLNTGTDKIKMIHSTNFSKWNQIVILGRNSIEWTRKLSVTLPPNLSDYKVLSRKNEHFQSAYKMTTDEAKYIIGTVSNCRIIDDNNVIVYIPPST